MTDILTVKLNNMRLKFWSRKKSFKVTDYDPEYKVIYLGNVLTSWAKGEGSIDKPLATLLKNYRSNVNMNLTICNSGLKAITRQHGLTEYWANRITYASTHPNHPKIFCWIYRHEGRRMKQELRCHAVVCNKESKAKEMAELLNRRLISALQEFRREKKYRQNVRLSLASSCQDIPLRKQFLIKGFANFRQPLERSKSAPKLTSIIEALGDEEEEEEEEEEEDNSRFDEDEEFANIYGSVCSDSRETIDADSLSENFPSLTVSESNTYCTNGCDNCVQIIPNPCLEEDKLNSISETREYEDTISDESGYSETGDTVSGKSGDH